MELHGGNLPRVNPAGRFDQVNLSTGGPTPSPAACEDDRVLVTVLAGGIGGSRFLRGVRAELDARAAGGDRADEDLVAVVNTADDITLFGLRVSPDLDTVMYTLGGGSDEERGWGRSDETFTAKAELAAYGAQPDWFGLGDRDLATHIVRTQMLDAGFSLSQVTDALCRRWELGLRLLPMTDQRVETHIVVSDVEAPAGARAMHFQEFWVLWHATLPVRDVVLVGIEETRPASGVLEAISAADVVLLAPSNPVVSVGPILAVPGIREALEQRTGPVVGVSPIISGSPVRGMADKLLPAIGVETDAGAVGLHYGSRRSGGVLDGWLVDESDAAAVPALEGAGIAARAVPLFMHDVAASRALAAAAFELAGSAGGPG